MHADGFDAHQFSTKLEFWDPKTPSEKYSMLVKDFTITIRKTLPDGEVLPLQMCCGEMLPTEQLYYNLKWPQIQALWLIAEGDTFPRYKKKGFAGNFLAKKLNMKHSQFSRDVGAPLMKRRLVCVEKQIMQREKAKHPAWGRLFHLERTNIRNIFFILLDVFKKRNFNDMVNWTGGKITTIEEASRENVIAEIRYETLSRLQRELYEYEHSAQYFIDRGVNPPASMSMATQSL